MTQTTIDSLKPSALRVLYVLQHHAEVSALDFKRGAYTDADGERVWVDAVSQRVGELRRAGYNIASTGRGGHAPAVYRLERGRA